MKYHSDIDDERDDATGGYVKYYEIFTKYKEAELLKNAEEKRKKLHLVHHVDMDAILTGREKRLTIEESRHRGAELCKKFVNELKTHQSDNQTDEFKKEGFTQDDSIEF